MDAQQRATDSPLAPTRAIPWWVALARLGTLGVLMVVVLFFLGTDLWRYRLRTRGLEDGLAPTQPPLVQPRWGVNVALERYEDEEALRQALRQIHTEGLGTVRQRLPWADVEPQPGRYRWQRWDALLPPVAEEGLGLIVVLDGTPAWARAQGEEDNPYAPPLSVEAYARYAQALAQRYGTQILAYQVWDQPNIHPHWGQGVIDPAGYVRLLAAASAAIRAADPDALIIAGALAPNLETGGRNLSDVQFLREIYRRGAGAYFDVLGVRAYGFWTDAYDRRVDSDVLNLSRVILLREEMVRRGDAAKPVWAVESGWCALPADWQGRPSPQGSDDPTVQGERTEHALQRIQREWPWMGLVFVAHWQPLAERDDPLWGYALLGPDGQANPLLLRLQLLSQRDDLLYPGLHPLAARLDPATQTVPINLRFWGTDVTLRIADGSGETMMSVDGRERSVDLGAVPSPLRLARGLEVGVHGLALGGTPEQIGAVQTVQVGYRQDAGPLLWVLLGGGVALVWLGFAAVGTARQVPWRGAWARLLRVRDRLPPWLQAGLVAAPYVVVMLWPSPLPRAGLLLLYGLLAPLRPDVALAVAVAAIPLAPLLVRLPRGAFSLTELALLVAAFARAVSVVLARTEGRRRGLRLTLLDLAVLGIVLLGLGTSFLAEYGREALREWRVVVAEAAVLYLLLRTWDERRLPFGANRRGLSLVRLADVLWLSAVGVALYALLLYLTPQGVIVAEGVRRARAFYGSPNNLALYLDRLLPLGLAVAAWGSTRWRRWAYGLGALPIALVIVLTFSRGAWFLGVPAGLLVLAWLAPTACPERSPRGAYPEGRGKRGVRWLILGLLAVALVLLLALAGTERIGSLLDLSSGTSFLRLSLWQASWDMLRDHPWLGVGLDNFLYYYGDYIRPGAEVDRWLSHPHNVVLDFWLRLGMGGVVLLVLALVGFGRAARRAWRAGVSGDQGAMLLGFVAGMAAALAHGLIDSAFFVVELAAWFMFALAFVGRAYLPQGGSDAPAP